ncbi:MAG TPA: hypothetical protein VFQ47_02760 [Nitrososphaera sp.]|nr:hypothetical protein [Nitrososphaera sp.]
MSLIKAFGRGSNLTPELTRPPTIIDNMSTGDNLDERHAKAGRVE